MSSFSTFLFNQLSPPLKYFFLSSEKRGVRVLPLGRGRSFIQQGFCYLCTVTVYLISLILSGVGLSPRACVADTSGTCTGRSVTWDVNC